MGVLIDLDVLVSMIASVYWCSLVATSVLSSSVIIIFLRWVVEMMCSSTSGLSTIMVSVWVWWCGFVSLVVRIFIVTVEIMVRV